MRSVVAPLVARWRPAVLVHLSEEVPREDPGELRHVYAQARLVLRPYYHHHEPAFRAMLQQTTMTTTTKTAGSASLSLYSSLKSGGLGGNVVIVPIGYGAGVVGTGPDGRPRSGVSAALEWARGTTGVGSSSSGGGGSDGGGSGAAQRELKWAFAGRLGVHPSRGAMSNVFSGASGAWGRSYERHVHTGIATS